MRAAALIAAVDVAEPWMVWYTPVRQFPAFVISLDSVLAPSGALKPGLEVSPGAREEPDEFHLAQRTVRWSERPEKPRSDGRLSQSPRACLARCICQVSPGVEARQEISSCSITGGSLQPPAPLSPSSSPCSFCRADEALGCAGRAQLCREMLISAIGRCFDLGAEQESPSPLSPHGIKHGCLLELTAETQAVVGRFCKSSIYRWWGTDQLVLQAAIAVTDTRADPAEGKGPSTVLRGGSCSGGPAGGRVPVVGLVPPSTHIGAVPRGVLQCHGTGGPVLLGDVLGVHGCHPRALAGGEGRAVGSQPQPQPRGQRPQPQWLKHEGTGAPEKCHQSAQRPRQSRAVSHLNISKLEIATSSAKRLTHTEEFFHTQKPLTWQPERVRRTLHPRCSCGRFIRAGGLPKTRTHTGPPGLIPGSLGAAAGGAQQLTGPAAAPVPMLQLNPGCSHREPPGLAPHPAPQTLGPRMQAMSSGRARNLPGGPDGTVPCGTQTQRVKHITKTHKSRGSPSTCSRQSPAKTCITVGARGRVPRHQPGADRCPLPPVWVPPVPIPQGSPLLLGVLPNSAPCSPSQPPHKHPGAEVLHKPEEDKGKTSASTGELTASPRKAIPGGAALQKGTQQRTSRCSRPRGAEPCRAQTHLRVLQLQRSLFQLDIPQILIRLTKSRLCSSYISTNTAVATCIDHEGIWGPVPAG
ncbi:hypothetical protein Anapl_02052 [Anas platyrhynchos]|uniref:Uncharacterized protein n=1 Tax=Anas platyrhynchos TaxID=8839 RepID=R0LYU8_ANAPL|nr:hypothetical protein Anapl_02052 [Anas platyrhynchos]